MRGKLLISLLAIAGVGIIFAGIALGAKQIDIAEVFSSIFAFDPNNNSHLVVIDSRLPRTLVALIAGALVAISGSYLQAVTNNPLADPGILGINASAALAVLLGASIGVSAGWGVIAFSFVGALAGALFLAALSLKQGIGPLQVTIGGVAITAGISSLSYFVLIVSPDVMNAFRHWSLGSLVGLSWEQVATLAIPGSIALAIGLLGGKALNAMSLGQEQSQALGLNRSRSSAFSFLFAALAAGLATAFVGPLVFIGLMAPTIARLIVGVDHRKSLAVSAVVGGLLLLIADVIGRLSLQPSELDAGVVVAIIGAPVVIAVLRGRFA